MCMAKTKNTCAMQQKFYNQGNATNRAYVVTLALKNGIYSASTIRTDDMSYRRSRHNAVVMPNGKILVIGGNPYIEYRLEAEADSTLVPEIWDPKTGLFTKVKNHRVFRNYHSTAVLLKDGRIMSAGGEHF